MVHFMSVSIILCTTTQVIQTTHYISPRLIQELNY